MLKSVGPDRGEVPVTDLIRRLLFFLPHSEPWRSLTREAVFIAVVAAAVITLEWLHRRDLNRYRTRNFFNDVLYSFFYQGGIYNLFIYIPLFAFLQKRLAFADLHILTALPAVAAFAIYWLITDFLGYWLHRFQHSNRFLWAFHSIHHTQTQMTFLTSNRNHLIDQFIANAIMFVPLLVLGVPKKVWIPFLLVHSAVEALQHAELNWKYGPLYRLIVSPLFHNLHHSTKASEYNGNYSKILSIWDFVFGTAVDREELPPAYGVEGLDVPETVSGQLLAPFRLLARRQQRVGARATVETSGV
jgi:sterol desaturase/sphingolipid hydroxylase (fatty acid hydroxylase superfamily)